MSATAVLQEPIAQLLADGTLTVPEAERFSGLGRSSLYEAIGDGRLPFTKVGARRLIPKRGLVSFLAHGLVGGQQVEAAAPAGRIRERAIGSS